MSEAVDARGSDEIGLWDRLRWLWWLAAAVLVASLAVTAWGYLRDRQLDAATRHDNALIIATERLLSSLKDVETGQRGFIITRKDEYLEPYRSGLAAVPADLATVSALDGSEAQPLANLVKDRVSEATKGVEAYQTAGAAAGVDHIQSDVGKTLMDRVRVQVAGLQEAADERIASAQRDRATDDLLRGAAVIGFILSFGGLGFVAVGRRREHRASQALLEGVLENAPIGLGFLDRSLRIRHINGALAKMSERALSATPGMSIWEVVPQLRDTLEAKLGQVVEGGRSIANVDVEAASNLRQDQTRHFQASFYPLGKAGSRGGVVAGIGVVDAMRPAPIDGQATRTECGRPRSSMRLRTWTATSTSVARRPSVCERSPSPMTRLKRDIAVSARARLV